MKKACIILFIYITTILSFTVSDSSSKTESEVNDSILQRLSKRLEQLELELEQYKRAQVKNPLSTGTYRNWGQGLNIAVEYPYLSAEIGYTFKIAKENIRLGFAGGYSLRPFNHGGTPEEMHMIGDHYTYIKVLVGSPVFFNLMSFSVSVAQLDWRDRWTQDVEYYEEQYLTSEDAVIWGSSNVVGNITATQLSANTEFWLSPRLCFILGFNSYINKFIPKNDIQNLLLTEYPDKTPEFMKEEQTWATSDVKIGARFYFGSFRAFRNRLGSRKK